MAGKTRKKKQAANERQGVEGRNILQKIKRRKANWIGHILGNNCLLKHVEGKIKEYKWREDEEEEASS